MNARILLAPLVAAGALALFAAHAQAGSGPKGAAKATFIKGEVTAGASADGKAEPTFARVKRGQELVAGSILKTGEGSRAEITFSDGSVVRVGPSAELKLDGASFDGQSKEVKVDATLVAGQAWAKVSKLVGDESKFQVKTQNAVAGVRGTVFRVNVERDEATVVRVYNGAVAVAAPMLTGSEEPEVTGPIDPNRKPIAKPFTEVSKKEFEHVLGKMMQIRIGKGGTVAAATPTPFTEEEDTKAEPEWVRWNSARDAGKDTEKSD